MPTAAKFPSAALADFGGELPGFPEATLSGAHNNSTPTITLTATVPTAWPNVGWVTIDSEIIKYAAKSGATLTGCTRGDQSAYGGSAAASHLDQAKVGFYLTPQVVNQIIAEIIAMQTSVSNPNLILNSDFGRRTTFGLAMPEVFADTSGYTRIDGGTAPTVSANILTQGAANNEEAWAGASFVWRDGRASATFKATVAAGKYGLRWRVDANNYIELAMNQSGANTLELRKVIGGTATNNIATSAFTLTVNQWYWLELEKQSTTIVCKLYSTGGTASGVTKASSTLQATITGTVSDAGVQVGAHISIISDQSTAQWGGIATGNGGVYVETWLPESWQDIALLGGANFLGTLGGQAIGFNEAADSGPPSPYKQWSLRFYIPAASRRIQHAVITPDGSIAASTVYAGSMSFKTTGKGGSGVLFNANFQSRTSALASDAGVSVSDAGETSWTRKSAVLTTGATARRGNISLDINPNVTATGTLEVQLFQLEQGSAATAWRNAPADDAPIVWSFISSRDVAAIGAAEADSRDLAANIFLPWDARLCVRAKGMWANSGANNDGALVSVDGSNSGTIAYSVLGATVTPLDAVSDPGHFAALAHAAGKTRIALRMNPAAGTITLYGTSYQNTQLQIIAYRGK